MLVTKYTRSMLLYAYLILPTIVSTEVRYFFLVVFPFLYSHLHLEEKCLFYLAVFGGSSRFLNVTNCDGVLFRISFWTKEGSEKFLSVMGRAKVRANYGGSTMGFLFRC